MRSDCKRRLSDALAKELPARRTHAPMPRGGEADPALDNDKYSHHRQGCSNGCVPGQYDPGQLVDSLGRIGYATKSLGKGVAIGNYLKIECLETSFYQRIRAVPPVNPPPTPPRRIN